MPVLKYLSHYRFDRRDNWLVYFTHFPFIFPKIFCRPFKISWNCFLPSVLPFVEAIKSTAMNPVYLFGIFFIELISLKFVWWIHIWVKKLCRYSLKPIYLCWNDFLPHDSETSPNRFQINWIQLTLHIDVFSPVKADYFFCD